jgi:hypothetical protein
MSREVRRVSENWDHPKRKGKYIPLYGDNFAQRLEDWELGNDNWENGFRENYGDGEKWVAKKGDEIENTFKEWNGPKPLKEDYMPDWSDAEKTHIQMYETTSEGTPISPVMDTPENLARWLVDNKASAFASETATYEQWLNTINRGFAFSMAIQCGVIQSGVKALSQ